MEGYEIQTESRIRIENQDHKTTEIRSLGSRDLIIVIIAIVTTVTIVTVAWIYWENTM